MRAIFWILPVLLLTAPCRPASSSGACDDAPRRPPARGPEATPPIKKPGGPAAATVARQLDDGECASITKALSGRSVKAVFHSGERVGAELTLRVRYEGISNEEDLRRAIQADIVPAAQAALPGDPTTASLSLVFLTCFRDNLGAVTLRPYETVGCLFTASLRRREGGLASRGRVGAGRCLPAVEGVGLAVPA